MRWELCVMQQLGVLLAAKVLSTSVVMGKQRPGLSHGLLPGYARAPTWNIISRRLTCSKGLVYLTKRCQAMPWHQSGTAQADVHNVARLCEGPNV